MKKILFCLVLFAGASSLRAAQEKKEFTLDEIALEDKEHNIDEIMNILGNGLNQNDCQKVIKDVRTIKKSLTHLKETITIGANVTDEEAARRVTQVLANRLIDRVTDDAIEIGCFGLFDRKRK